MSQKKEFTLKQFGILCGLVFLMLISISVLYGSINGFDRLGSDAGGAPEYMTGFQTTQMGNAPSGQQFSQSQLSMHISGQYVCPQHGGVGLPVFDAYNYPHCPICNQVMQFTSSQPHYSPLLTVAAPG